MESTNTGNDEVGVRCELAQQAQLCVGSQHSPDAHRAEQRHLFALAYEDGHPEGVRPGVREQSGEHTPADVSCKLT